MTTQDKETLLQEIDNAIKQAPILSIMDTSYKGFQEKSTGAFRQKLIDWQTSEAKKEGIELTDWLNKHSFQPDKATITFKTSFPGEGVYTLPNIKEHLHLFRDLVERKFFAPEKKHKPPKLKVLTEDEQKKWFDNFRVEEKQRIRTMIKKSIKKKESIWKRYLNDLGLPIPKNYALLGSGNLCIYVKPVKQGVREE